STTRPSANESWSATQSAARWMSPLCAASMLTLGIATNSASAARRRSEDGVSTVDRQHLAGDPRRLVGNEEEHAVRNVLRCAEPPRRDRLEQPLLSLFPVALELRDRRRVREDEARRDRVHRDPERAELVGGLPREPELPCLGARVCLDSREADAASGAGRDVDDPPVAALLHPGRDRARADERARQVRIDDGLAVLVGDLFERPSDLPDDAARVVDEDVDPP